MVKHVLDGVKVADFSWIGATPLATRELAHQGAMVIRIECHRAMDDLRVTAPFAFNKPDIDGSGVFGSFNAGKYSISLDLNRPGSKEAARRLVLWADIVAQNMVPGTMARWGLDYESCRKIKPDIIYLSSSSEGGYGPLAKMHGHGYQAVGTVGFSHITGWPDRGPILLRNAYTDTVAPFFSAFYVVAALAYHKRTGKGMHIEQSQNEAGACMLGHVYLDCAVNNRTWQRQGNRDPAMAPHGVYPCSGQDKWVAIAVSNEEEWQGFCQAVVEDWTAQPRFETMVLRKRNEDDLDRLVAGWTASRTREDIMTLMQSRGVPAAIVEASSDLYVDPQLAHRGHYVRVPHKVMGTPSYRTPAYRLSKTPHDMSKATPCLGEDNYMVYHDLLGFSEDEISDMLANGVITTEQDIPRPGEGRKH